MKICNSCGTQNSEEFLFCQSCGGVLAASAAPFVSGQTADMLNPAQKTQKEMFASPRFLVTAILFSLATLFGPIMSIITFVSNGSRYSQSLSFDDMESMLNALSYNVNAVTTINLVTNIFSLALGSLIVIAFFHTYFNARNSGQMKTAGLSIFKGMSIFYLVVLFAAFVFLLTAAVVAASISGSSYDAAFAVGIVIGLLLVMPLPILFYIFTIKTVDSLKTTATTGIYNGKVSAFVGVMCFIIGGLMALFVIISLISTASLSSYYVSNMGSFIFSTVISLLNCTFYILLGVGIFSYRSRMAAYISFNTPGFPPVYVQPQVYTQPVYYAPPQQQYYQQPQQFQPTQQQYAPPQQQYAPPQASAQQQPAQQYVPPQQQPYTPPAPQQDNEQNDIPH